MLLRIFTEPQQGASYEQLLAMARAAEDAGFDAFFRSDHYSAMGAASGLPGPTDAWVTLAGLARDTIRIRLGTLVTAATFRLPGPLALAVAQVDAMSGGRVELGIGAGWYEQEHRSWGIPFPPLGERFERLDEQLEIITGIWSTPIGALFSFSGRHYQLEDCPALPKPTQQPRPPIMLGGTGARRTPELIARYGDECNVPFASLDTARTQFDRVAEACARADRDVDTITRSVVLVACCGRTDVEVTDRAAVIGRAVPELRANGLAGSPDELVDKIGRYRDIGVQRIYLQMLDLDDLDHLELIASDVLRQVETPRRNPT